MNKVTGVIAWFVEFVSALVVTSALWGIVPTIDGMSGYVDLIHALFVIIDIGSLIAFIISLFSPED